MRRSEEGQNGGGNVNRTPRKDAGRMLQVQANDLPGSLNHSPRTSNKKILPNGTQPKVTFPTQEKVDLDDSKIELWGEFQWVSSDKGDKSEKSNDSKRGWLCGLFPSATGPNETNKDKGTEQKKTKFHRIPQKENGDKKLKAVHIEKLLEKWHPSTDSDPKLNTTSTKAPRMTLSLVAVGEKSVKPKIQSVRRMANELITFVADTDSWLLVQGCMNSEIFKYVGDALGNHQLVGKDKFTTIIAVSPWPEIALKGFKKGETDAWVIDYNTSDEKGHEDETTEEDKRNSKKNDNKSQSKSRPNSNFQRSYKYDDTRSPGKTKAERMELNPNIKNYIFCEKHDGSKNLNHLVNLTKERSENKQKVDENDKNSVKQQDCKLYKCMILVAGDKSCIDIIKESVANDIPVILIKGLGGVSDIFCEVVEKTKKGGVASASPEKQSGISSEDLYKLSIEIGKLKQNLLHVYDIETKSEKASLAYEILDAVITLEEEGKDKTRTNPESKEAESEADIHNKTMLELCIDANEFDLAESKNLIPKDCNNLKSSTVLRSVIHDRGTFADFFLAHGLDLKEHFTSEILHRELNELSDDKDQNLEIDKIHSEIPRLIGYFYKPAPKRKAPTINDLFIWSILHEKFEFAKAVWDHVEQPTAAALLAFGLIRKSILKNTQYTLKLETLKHYQAVFSTLAENNIKAWYRKDPEEVYVFLRGKMPVWGNTSCIRLATQTSNKSFLALEPCYILQERVWVWGDNITPDEQRDRYKNSSRLFPITSGDIMSMFSPRVMYCFNFLGFVLFLMAYALFIISRLNRDSFHFLEWILWVFIITFLLQEIFQLALSYSDQKPKADESTENEKAAKRRWAALKWLIKVRPANQPGYKADESTGNEKQDKKNKVTRRKLFKRALWEYQKDHFNKIDILSLLFFFLAWFFRLAAYFRPQEQYWMDAARTLFSVDFIIFMLRLLRYFYISHQFGPMVLMVSHMLATLFRFLIVLSPFYLAYAIGSEAVLYPESKMSWNLVFHILRKAYWNMFGELFLDEISADGSDVCTACTNDPDVYNTYDILRCPTQVGRYVVPVMLGVYLLTVNILMFNLLIAQFSTTIIRIEADSRTEWSYQRSLMLREFSRSILPFPFTLVNVLLYVVGRGHYADSDPFFYNSPPPKEGSNISSKRPSAKKQEAQEREAVTMQNEQAKTEMETTIVNVMENRVIPTMNNFYQEHMCCCQKDNSYERRGDINSRLTRIENALMRLENRKRDELERRMDETYRRKIAHSQSWDSSPPVPPTKRSFSVDTQPGGSHTHFQVIPK